MADKKTSRKKTPRKAVLVEIAQASLDKLLKEATLEIGKNVRLIKALEINPGAVIAKQYDR